MTEIEDRINAAIDRYGPLASTHEAMGVALEEWTELIDAVRANDLQAIAHESLDLAAVLLRLARTIRENDKPFAHRSRK
jgi:NTP pyrophosphatase (non-canonical NTP hydrolase)